MITMGRTVFFIFLAAAALTGCRSTGEDELRQWMTEQRSNTKPSSTPLKEPKKFIPEPYSQAGGLDPFNPLKLTQVLRSDSAQVAANATLVAPELVRRKEPLESFPLDTMVMVGSIDKKGVPTALLRVNSLIYQVKLGSYLGQNYGKIVKISDSSIQLREIAQDGSGDWTERSASLELQEVKN